MLKQRKAFTLIEVMISVIIISVVIMALLQMFSNNTHIFSSFKEKKKINQYSSFFISNIEIGFEDESTTLHRLIEEFPLEDDFRRKLKEMKVDILYQELETIDMSEFDGSEEEDKEENEEEKESNSNMVFEVGKTILRAEGSSVSILRLRLQ